MNTILIEHLTTLVTMNPAGEELKDAYLFLEDGFVRALGSGEPPPGLREKAWRILNGREKVALPGLVNTHHHLYQSITRAMPQAQDAKLFNWLVALYPIWGRLGAPMIGSAVRTSMAELLLSGCTTTVDHTFTGNDAGFAREILADTAEAAKSLGIRLYLAVGGATLGESRGGIQPDSLVASEEMLLDLYAWAASSLVEDDWVRVAIGPSSLFAVGYEFLGETATLAQELGVPRHIHVAESLDERAFACVLYGDVPINLMEKQGWIEEDVWFAHAVHINSAEIKLFATSRVGIAHCPSSNMRLGSGIAPIRSYLDAGVKVGLGVDGSASNDGGHLLGEARQALLLARVADGAEALTAREALRLATKGGAEVLGRKDLGELGVGKAADVAIYSLDDISLAGAESDPVAALALCWPPRADTVISGGEVVVEEGKLVRAELEALVTTQRKNSFVLLEALSP